MVWWVRFRVKMLDRILMGSKYPFQSHAQRYVTDYG